MLHPHTTTKEVIDDFRVMFHDYKLSNLCSLDIIFMAGDLFDRVTEAQDPEFIAVCNWIHIFMNYCAKYNIILRFMKGTPSHDGNQTKIATVIANKFDNLDFAYVEDLSIEHIDKLNLDVLYVPDECRQNNRVIYEDTLSLMHEKNIQQVDIAIMHGMFRFQTNFKAIDSIVHYEEDYLKIVKHFINVAHIHTFKVYERIVGQGSFSRLAHGEQEDKGMVVMSINPDNPADDSFFFLVNKQAHRYVTIVLKDKDAAKSWDKIVKYTKDLPAFSHIRISLSLDHPFYNSFNEIKSKLALYHVKKDRLDKKVVQDKASLFLSSSNSYIPLKIDKDNIVELIMQPLSGSNNVHELLQLRSDLESIL